MTGPRNRETPRLGGGDDYRLRMVSEARERMHRAEDEAAALRVRVQELEQHLGDPPTQKRIMEAHSALNEGWGQTDPEGTHFAYKQGHTEACYICTLSRRVQELEAALREIRKVEWRATECTPFQLEQRFHAIANKALMGGAPDG